MGVLLSPKKYDNSLTTYIVPQTFSNVDYQVSALPYLDRYIILH